MMNHFAQESGAGSVLAEMHALRAIREMRRGRKLHLRSTTDDGQGLTLNAHQCAIGILLHRATGRGVRLNGWRALWREDLYPDARQEQQYVSYAFHFSKSDTKVLLFSEICKFIFVLKEYCAEKPPSNGTILFRVIIAIWLLSPSS